MGGWLPALRDFSGSKAKVKKSKIHGFGLFAVRPIKKGEIVAIKGGHVFHEDDIEKMEAEADESYIQVEDEFYIGAMKKSEVEGNKMFLNHSCNPNLGIRGQISYIAMRSIKAGEELTYDWAMENPGRWRFKCHCEEKICRMIITGNDWKSPSLQKRYKGFFSAFIQEKIDKMQRK